METKKKDWKRFYEFFWVSILKGDDEELQIECFNCGKAMGANRNTGLYNCFRCGEKGNPIQFMQKFWESGKSVSSEINALGRLRGIPASILSKGGLREINGRLFVPTYSSPEKLSNLHVFNGKIFMAAPNTQNGVFLLNYNKKSKDSVLCEGFFDSAAYFSMNNKPDVIGVPGANVFKKEWERMFLGKRILVAYDNDNPGRKGIEKVRGMLKDKCKLTQIDWNGEKEKYDINDFKRDNGDPEELKIVDVGETKKKKSLEIEIPKNINGLIDLLGKEIQWSYDLKISFIVCMAVVRSTARLGENLWIRLIGPPGSGKTTICELMVKNENHCKLLSISRGFHSGFTNDGSDFSLILRVDKKAVFSKEGDTIVNSPYVEDILAQARDLYDGFTSTSYKNNKEDKQYENIRMSWVIAGTDNIRQLNRHNLGDRFLDCIINRPRGEEKAKLIRETMRSEIEGIKKEELEKSDLPEITSAYIDNMMEKTVKEVEIPDKFMLKIHYLSEFVAAMRTGEELPTRLSKQLVRLAYFSSEVMNKTEVDEEIYEIVKYVALCTAWGDSLNIVKEIVKSKVWSTIRKIEISSGAKNVGNLLRLLISTEMIEKKSSNRGVIYGPSSFLKEIIEETGIKL